LFDFIEWFIVGLYLAAGAVFVLAYAHLTATNIFCMLLTSMALTMGLFTLEAVLVYWASRQTTALIFSIMAWWTVCEVFIVDSCCEPCCDPDYEEERYEYEQSISIESSSFR
jgi:hypothetical protein